MNAAQVRVFEKAHNVRFTRLLEREKSGCLEPQLTSKVSRDLADESLERELPDKEFSRFLVFSYLAKSDGARSISVLSLDIDV